MTFRYLGSKTQVVEQIASHIGPWQGSGRFVDVFCGTGSVSEVAARLGWPLRINDHLLSATTVSAARVFSDEPGLFGNLGGYANALDLLRTSEPVQGFIWKEYSPASAAFIGFERRYFTERNAAKIDGIRANIRVLRRNGQISRTEEILLIADLISATNRVANIAGTYGCFLSKWTPQAGHPVTLRPRKLRLPSRTSLEVSNVDASSVRVDPHDMVYLDPPYTKRQYASYYHILETIARGDDPVVEGVAGLRPWKELASVYCYKIKALNALTTLVSRLPARRTLLSYSDEGHVNLSDLKTGLTNLGTVKIFELATVGRYRPNVVASASRSSVSECLIIIEKRSAQQRRAISHLAVA